MKKILISMFVLVFGLCIVGCNLLEKDKNLTYQKYENCTVFTFSLKMMCVSEKGCVHTQEWEEESYSSFK